MIGGDEVGCSVRLLRIIQEFVEDISKSAGQFRLPDELRHGRLGLFDVSYDAVAEPMEGTDVRCGEVARKPIRYLGSRLAVERQHQDLVWGNALIPNEVDDFPNDDRGLSRSCAREHKGHILVCSYRLGLFVRKRVRQRREGGGLHSRGVVGHEEAVRLRSCHLETLNWFEGLKPTERLPRFSFEVLSDETLALPKCRRDSVVVLARVMVSSIAVAGEELAQFLIQSLQTRAQSLGAPDGFRRGCFVDAGSLLKRSIAD